MRPLEAIVLGIIQGASEFLPISSSGHLILLPRLFGWADQGLAVDEALNTATLLAVLLYFRRAVRELTVGLWQGLRQSLASRSWQLTGAGLEAWRLGLATIPAAIAGLLLHDWIATKARSPVLVAVNLIVWGLVLALADRLGRRERDLDTMRLRDALLVGLAQALALVPGTSRSGITITAALLLGFRRPDAARFSFLLSIPIGLLVAVHDVLAIAKGGIPVADLPAAGLAFVAATVAGLAAIGGLLTWLRQRSVAVFAGYRVLLGAAILWLFWPAG